MVTDKVEPAAADEADMDLGVDSFEPDVDPLVAGGPSTPFISAFEVEALFGRYSYRVDVPEVDGLPSRLTLLHGENGAGKTTLLRLLWNLLSPADNRGHRSALARVPFHRFAVSLGDGDVIEVRRDEENLVGAFTIQILRAQTPVLTAQYLVDSDLDLLPDQQAVWAFNPDETSSLNDFIRPIFSSPGGSPQAKFTQYIQSLGAHPYLLADDRNLYSDDIPIENPRPNADRQPHPGRQLASVTRELNDALARVNRWFAQLTLGAQNVGFAGANSIYVNVLRELAQPAAEVAQGEAFVGLKAVRATFEKVAARAPAFESLGLVAPFDTTEFRRRIDALAPLPEHQQKIASGILLPYLESLQARFEALAEAEHLIRLLLHNANRYLRDKELTYSPRLGLRVLTTEGERLPLGSLSSGERQLVLLLCTTFLARSSGRVFIIDEPELSLSVPWQRSILGSLLDCTEGTQVQFFVATHSVEMVSGSRRALVALEPRRGR